MTNVNSLNLVRFLSAIFQPFSHLTKEQQEKMAEKMFGKETGDEILSELKYSSKTIYCEGKKYLTPGNVLFAIKDSSNVWKGKEIFVINTRFNKSEDQFLFREELAELFSHYPDLRTFISFSTQKINQKYLQEHKELTKSMFPVTVWNLYRYLNSYRLDMYGIRGNYAITLVELCDAKTFANSISEITDREFLVLLSTSMSLCRSDDIFYEELIKESKKTTSIRCAFVILLANKLRFFDDQTCNYQAFANKLIDKLKDRPDRFTIFAELIDCCNRIGLDKNICQAVVDAIFCSIENYLRNTEKEAKSLQKVFQLLYQFSSMKSVGYWVNFHSNETVENKLSHEILKYYVPKLNPENFSAFNISINSLNVLIKSFTSSYEDKPTGLSLFSRLNDTFTLHFEKEKSQSISISSNIAILNLLTIELLTYDALISAGHNGLITKASKTWKILEHWLLNWDFSLFTNQDEIYSKIYSVFQCKNYKGLVEKTLINLNNRPFPLINSIAVIFHLYPDLKEKYSSFVLDYVLRYKNQWEKQRIENILSILRFAGFKEDELKMD